MTPLVARVTKSTSQFGVEYDSLSDLVAFGVAPGILVYRWALEPWGSWGWLAASLYVTCGALRLARFNVQYDNVEKRHFIGLPIPAAAEMIASTVMLYYYFGGEGEAHKRLVLLLVVYALAGLMVSNIRYFSFKQFAVKRKYPDWLLLSAILFIIICIAAPEIMFFSCFLLYTLSGPLLWLLTYYKRRREKRGEPLAALP